MPTRFHPAAGGKLEGKPSGHPKELAHLIHVSRRIGGDPRLVLHGGGNTSVKVVQTDIFGEKEEILYVKGSGIDMASIGSEDFSALRLKPLRRLRQIPALTDDLLGNHLAVQRVFASSPDPSVEALLHAFLPHRFVLHCHADSVLILTHQKNPKAILRSVLGNRVAVIPYAKSGLPLAEAVVRAYERAPDIDALVVLHHGLFTFSEDATYACDRMFAVVGKAEFFLRKKLRATRIVTKPAVFAATQALRESVRVSQVIRGLCADRTQDGTTHRRLVVFRQSPELVRVSVSPEAPKICRSGVLTPDHAIRTLNRMVYLKSVPEKDDDLKKTLGKAVRIFQQEYARYLAGKKPPATGDLLQEKTLPILFLVAGVGLFAVGATLQAAHIAADIGECTVLAKSKGFALGDFRPTPSSHVREMELWPLQKKKLKAPSACPLTGQAAVITGGGGAIGYGIARRLLASGSVVAVTDIDDTRLEYTAALLSREFGPDRTVSFVFDVTDFKAVEKGFAKISEKFGGIDIVVPNAGIAHVATIENLYPDKLDRVVAVNLKGTFTVIKAAIPIFRRQGTGGNIVFISSKNVFDPGAAFSAYSASKAAAHQMAKIAAMELSQLGVRVNMINPDAVFGDKNVGSGLWELVGPDRMQSRGLSSEGLRDYYRERSLLKVSVLAEHVGNAVVFFASEQTPTTGASLPVDAGNPAAFPR